MRNEPLDTVDAAGANGGTGANGKARSDPGNGRTINGEVVDNGSEERFAVRGNGTEMAGGSTVVDLDLLLAQEGWVRSLARSLVRDPGGAEDVAQETLLAALKAPPRDAEDARRLRAWLGRVAFNQANLVVRRDHKRRSREIEAARPEALRSTSEKFVRESVLHLVVEAVRALDPAYRQVVLLRYFEGLSTVEIARITGSTDNAVRKRLWRARRRLRRLLADRHNGETTAWFRSLLPLVPLPVVSGTSGSSGVASWIRRTLTWRSPGQAAAVVGAMAGAIAVASLAWVLPLRTVGMPAEVSALDRGEPDEAGPRAVREELLGPGERGAGERQATGETEAVPREPEQTVPGPEEGAGEERPERSASLEVHGRVLDLDGAGVAGLAIAAAERPGEMLGFSGPEGVFELFGVAAPATLQAAGPGFVALRRSRVEAPGDGVEHLLIAAPCGGIAGRVIDETGRPVVGAQVRAEYGERTFLGLSDPLAGTLPVPVQTRSGAHGDFALREVVPSAGTELVAQHPGHAPALVQVPSLPGGELVLVLRTLEARGPVVLRGSVADASGRALDGVQISVGERSTRSGLDGGFSLGLDDLRTGDTLVASRQGFEPVAVDLDPDDDRGDDLGEDLDDGKGGWKPPPVSLRLVRLDSRVLGRIVTPLGAAPEKDWLVGLERDPGSEAGNGRWDQPDVARVRQALGPDGSFGLDVPSGEPVRVVAWSSRSLAMIATEVFRPDAGRSFLELEVPRGIERESLSGRVISLDGAPVAGARVTVTRQIGHERLRGNAAFTDAAGYFELGAVARDGIELLAEHPQHADGLVAPTATAERDGTLVCLARLASVQVNGMAGGVPGTPDSFAVLDAGGEELSLLGPTWKDLAGSNGMLRRGAIHGGTDSLAFSVSSTAKTVVFYRAGLELGRIGVAISADGTRFLGAP